MVVFLPWLVFSLSLFLQVHLPGEAATHNRNCNRNPYTSPLRVKSGPRRVLNRSDAAPLRDNQRVIKTLSDSWTIVIWLPLKVTNLNWETKRKPYPPCPHQNHATTVSGHIAAYTTLHIARVDGVFVRNRFSRKRQRCLQYIEKPRR